MAARKIRSKKHARKRREARIRQLKLYAVFAVFILAILGGVTHLNAVQITDVEVETDSNLEAELILELAATTIDQSWLLGAVRRDNILLLPRADITRQIRAVSTRIKEVDVSLSGLQSVDITIGNRQPVAQACQNAAGTSSDCYLVDENGFIFAQANGDGTDLLTYTTMEPPRSGTQLLPVHRFVALRSFIGAIDEMEIETNRVDLQPAGDVTLRVVSASNTDTEQGGEVDIRINMYQELPQIASNLRSAINSRSFVAAEPSENGMDQPISPFSLEYIDLRFENKVFYR
ncbi:MAG: hypothetical protein WD335_02485 [Candidatus Paceibacterota bacterium]